MEEKNKVSLSDLERAIDEAILENSWVEICDLPENSPTEKPTTTGEGLSATDNILMCKVCQVSFSGIQPYEQHMNGSKHKKKLTKETMKNKYGTKYLEASMSQEKGTEPTVVTGEDDNGDDVTVTKCNVCNKTCTGVVSYKLHVTGKSHQKQLRKQKCIEKLQETSNLDDEGKEVLENSVYNVMPQVKPFAHCEVCEKKFSGPEGFEEHLSSASHKRKLEMQKLMKRLTGESAQPSSMSTNDGSKQDVFARCEACEKNFSGPVPYQQHLISEAHKKKLKKLELVEEMKSLSMNGGEEDTFYCKECERSFHIPEEFKQHLNSTSHNKRKVKQQMVEKLQKEYPEIEVETEIASHDDSSENRAQLLDDRINLMCKVCHNSFSGPENAIAHFSSQKHERAKKKHLLFMQNKKAK